MTRIMKLKVQAKKLGENKYEKHIKSKDKIYNRVNSIIQPKKMNNRKLKNTL